MRISQGQKEREAKKAAFDAWKAKNPIVFHIRPLGTMGKLYDGFIPTLNGMAQYMRTGYQTFVSKDWQ